MGYSFVTYLGTDNFLPGVLALGESLRRYNKTIFLLVLVNENVSDENINLLMRKNYEIKRIDSIKNPLKLKNDEKGFKYLYTKLRIFDLTEFEKIIYIDADIIVCKNIEELFAKPHMSAVAAGALLNPDWKNLNSGFTVIKPNRELFESMLNSVHHLYSNGGDQGFLNSFYHNWAEESHLHLAHTYNVPFIYLENYCNDFGFNFSYLNEELVTDIAIMHYWGVIKPWQIDLKECSRDESSKNIQALFLWWDMYTAAIETDL